MSDGLKKIREALLAQTTRTQHFGNKDHFSCCYNPVTEGHKSTCEAIRVLTMFDAHVATLSQQEAEPVDYWRDLEEGELIQIGDRCMGRELRWFPVEPDMMVAGQEYSRKKRFPMQRRVSPPKPAPLPQPEENLREKFQLAVHCLAVLWDYSVRKGLNAPEFDAAKELLQYGTLPQPVDDEPTYDDACETIEAGLQDLLGAIGQDAEAYGDDIAPAAYICQALEQIAKDLTPLGIKFNEDTGEYFVPQGLEEFIAANRHLVSLPGITGSAFTPAVTVDDFREFFSTWMAGHVRVPVEPRLMVALRRFRDTTEDEGTYDIDDATISELAELGVIQRRGVTKWYQLTKVGSAILAATE